MAATIRSLGVCVPRSIITNDAWPRVVVEQRARATALRRRQAAEQSPATREEALFYRLMAPYMDDPFRGAVERRWLSEEHSIVEMEVGAIEQALSAAALKLDDVDLLLSSAFCPEPRHQGTVGVGHAAYIARALGYEGAAWNVESACAITPIALLQACALVDAGHYRAAIVIISCSYGRHSDPADPISASVGDAATAYVVCDEPSASRCVSHVENTHRSIGAVAFETAVTENGESTVHLKNRPGGSRLIWTLCTEKLVSLVDAVLAKSGHRRDEIDTYAFNTPLAWYAQFARLALELPEGSVTNVHPKYANVGPCLPGLSLQEAFERGHSTRGNVLIHSIGSVSSAACALFPQADIRCTEAAQL